MRILMNRLVAEILELMKRGEISRSVARSLLQHTQQYPENNDAQDKRVAIIGISAELPGAKNIDEFWDVLIQKEDRISPLSSRRRELCEPFVRKHGERLGIDSNNPFWQAAWIEDIDQFDPHFFNITPAEARVMDPQQRRFLQVAYNCFEDAGYAGNRIRGSKTGVYMSAALVNYVDALTEFTPKSVTGNVPAFVGSRISYMYDLKGPSFVVGATCASSLLAIHEACLGLINGDCEMALVGGVNIFPFPVNASNIFMNAAGIMSDEQKCRPFDNKANGIGRGEGVIALLLKPYKKALEDKDNIHAVILASAINNDGLSAGITAPNPKSHTELYLDAWKKAGITPESLSYIEAHGTGTNLGDPIEIKGITDAVRKTTDKKQFIALGSVKGNIGHLLDGAAGLSGLIKAVLVLKRGVVPPTVNLTEPNQHIDFLNSPVFVPVTPWNLKENHSDRPLRAGVNCFGFNGTNVHVVLEEAPKMPEPIVDDQIRVYPISARTKKSLYSLIEKYVAQKDYLLTLDPDSVSYTLWSGREHFENRVAIVANNIKQLLEICQKIVSSGDLEYTVYAHEHLSDINELQLKLANEYVRGKNVPWHKLFRNLEVRKVSLPTYCFDEQSYWLEEEVEKSTVIKEVDEISQLMFIVRSVLEMDDIEPKDNFIEVGGDSLSALQLISRLKKEFPQCDITLEEFLAIPDFESLAKRIFEANK